MSKRKRAKKTTWAPKTLREAKLPDAFNSLIAVVDHIMKKFPDELDGIGIVARIGDGYMATGFNLEAMPSALFKEGVEISLEEEAQGVTGVTGH